MNLWRNYRQQRGLRREGSTLLLCFVIGALLIPIGIYVVGHALLGSYSDGGMFRYLGDFWQQLFKLSPAFWLVALGPYLAVWFARLVRSLPHR
jgi:hypothetical protein